MSTANKEAILNAVRMDTLFYFSKSAVNPQERGE